MIAKESSLTVGEKKQLATLEQTIDRGVKSFVEVGNALAEIKSAKLFTDTADTFEGYCKKRWGFAKSRAYQYIEAAKVVEVVSTNGGKTVPNERVARELASVEKPSDQKKVWQAVVESAPKDDKGEPKITAAHVAHVIEETAAGKESKGGSSGAAHAADVEREPGDDSAQIEADEAETKARAKRKADKEKAITVLGQLNRLVQSLGLMPKLEAKLQEISNAIRRS